MQFVVYHTGVAQALADYRQRYGSDPGTLIVHPTAQVAAPEGIAVEHNGGCLAGELWLPMPETTIQQATLPGSGE